MSDYAVGLKGFGGYPLRLNLQTGQVEPVHCSWDAPRQPAEYQPINRDRHTAPDDDPSYRRDLSLKDEWGYLGAKAHWEGK